MATLKLGTTTAITESSGALTIASSTLTTPTIASMANCTFPAGHVLRAYHKVDNTLAIYTSPQHPLGSLQTETITTTIANSKLYVSCQVSSSWGDTASATHTVGATDWGLYIQRNNVSGTTTTKIGGCTSANDSSRGGENAWYGNDDCNVGYNSYDTRCFVMTHLDAPAAAAGTTLNYSVGVAGSMSSVAGDFAYNRIWMNAVSNSASTITVMEIAP